MHKLESILENETSKSVWDSEIQTDQPILARRPDPVFINKKKRTCYLVDFVIPEDHRVKIKESENLFCKSKQWEIMWRYPLGSPNTSTS